MREWIEDARCATGMYGVEFFFPQQRSDTEAAQKFCSQCPVAQKCLDLAMANEQDHARYGIFGGLTPEQRRELYRATRG